MLDIYHPMSMKGKNIVVFGASSGLGRECAIVLSKLGARIILVARNEAGLLETLRHLEGNQHNYYTFDLNNIDNINLFIKKLTLEQGCMDGVCYTAGITGSKAIRPLKTNKYSFIKDMFDIHTFAFMELVRCLSSKGIMNQYSSIVGISSAAAYRAAVGEYAYAAAKAANDAFIKSVAIELSKKKIRINSIAFGALESDAYYSVVEQVGDPSLVLENQYMGPIAIESAAKLIAFVLGDSLTQMTGNTIEYFAGR